MSEFRIFIAHSERDKQFIKKLCSRLCKVGLSNYYLAESPDNFQPDKALAETVMNELNNKCQCVVGVMTARSINSPWVNQEIAYAYSAGRKLVMIVEVGIEALALVSPHQHASFYGSEISSDIRKKVIPYLLGIKKQGEVNG